MAAEGPPGKTPPEKALLTDSTDSGPLIATGNDSKIEMLVVRALRRLVDAFSNVRDETEPYDPTNEDDNTELTESDAISVSGDSTGTSADSVDELGGYPVQVPSAESSEDSDFSSGVFPKAEPTTDTQLEVITQKRPKPDGGLQTVYELTCLYQHNHGVGCFSDVETRQKSEAIRATIKKLTLGGSTISMVMRQLTMEHGKFTQILRQKSCFSRNDFITYDDVYNIWHDDRVGGLYFGFPTTWQMDQLKAYGRMIYFDGTHNVF
ncbi:hypothetical protein FBU30_010242, partial [Linnemannia zychae]